MKGYGLRGYGLSNRSHLGGAVAPTPSLGFFEPLSWTGARVVDYDFNIPSSTKTNYNSISRASTGGTTFNMGIYSVETFSSDEDFYYMGDAIDAFAGASFFIGISLASKTGDHYSDIDYSFFVSSLNVNWFENATNGGLIATLTASQNWSYRFEHISASNEIKLYINNVLVKTVVTPYSSDTLNVRILGRNANHLLTQHTAVVKTLTPNKFLGALGDSITFGRAISGNAKSNYIERTLANLGNTYFTNPLLALAGDTTADVITMQLPLVASTYDATRTKNIYTLMIGINDLRASVSLATIQANITTIVGDLQTAGFEVVIQTVLPDFNTAWVDRAPLNTWILANSIGAEYVVDYRSTLLETDVSLYEVDKLHPLPTGMQLIADNLWLTINSI